MVFFKHASCPNCNHRITFDKTSCDHCGYEYKVLICPTCASIYAIEKYTTDEQKKIQRTAYYSMMNKSHIFTCCFNPLCNAQNRMVELNCTISEYLERMDQMLLDCGYEGQLPTSIWLFQEAHLLVQRQLFEEACKTMAFDVANPAYQANIAAWYDESLEEHIFSLIEKWNESWAKEKARREAWRKRHKVNIPHCPICKSTNLSKLSHAATVTNVVAFGVLSAADVGKTWKCENCGSKF